VHGCEEHRYVPNVLKINSLMDYQTSEAPLVAHPCGGVKSLFQDFFSGRSLMEPVISEEAQAPECTFHRQNDAPLSLPHGLRAPGFP
jgi:hypothetical protein